MSETTVVEAEADTPQGVTLYRCQFCNIHFAIETERITHHTIEVCPNSGCPVHEGDYLGGGPGAWEEKNPDGLRNGEDE